MSRAELRPPVQGDSRQTVTQVLSNLLAIVFESSERAGKNNEYDRGFTAMHNLQRAQSQVGLRSDPTGGYMVGQLRL